MMPCPPLTPPWAPPAGAEDGEPRKRPRYMLVGAETAEYFGSEEEMVRRPRSSPRTTQPAPGMPLCAWLAHGLRSNSRGCGVQPTSTPLGSLLLCEVLNVTSRSDDATGFTIQCQYRNYECFADSESDRDAWVAALHSAAESGSGGAGASAAADPLGLLDELVTVVEPSYAKHVDAVTSGYATLRENLLMSQQRASVKAAGLEVARDDIALLNAKLAQLEAARAESEARAAAAEEIAQQQAAQLASFNNKLTVASTAAVGLQCVVDEGRRSIQELRLESGLPTLVPHSPPKPMAGRDESVQEEASRLTVEGLSVTLDSIEKLASQLYDRTHEALSGTPTPLSPLFLRRFSPVLRRAFAVLSALSGFLAPRRRERAKNGEKWAKFGGETGEKQRWLSGVGHSAFRGAAAHARRDRGRRSRRHPTATPTGVVL